VRLVAQAAFYLSGWLSKIQTPKRFHRVVSFRPFVTEPSGWHLSPCRPSMKLLKVSMRLDWDHWDHWALEHVECDPQPCTVCKGLVCPEEDEPDHGHVMGI
jgi:hypothetical protein